MPAVMSAMTGTAAPLWSPRWKQKNAAAVTTAAA